MCLANSFEPFFNQQIQTIRQNKRKQQFHTQSTYESSHNNTSLRLFIFLLEKSLKTTFVDNFPAFDFIVDIRYMMLWINISLNSIGFIYFSTVFDERLLFAIGGFVNQMICDAMFFHCCWCLHRLGHTRINFNFVKDMILLPFWHRSLYFGHARVLNSALIWLGRRLNCPSTWKQIENKMHRIHTT